MGKAKARGCTRTILCRKTTTRTTKQEILSDGDEATGGAGTVSRAFRPSGLRGRPNIFSHKVPLCRLCGLPLEECMAAATERNLRGQEGDLRHFMAWLRVAPDAKAWCRHKDGRQPRPNTRSPGQKRRSKRGWTSRSGERRNHTPPCQVSRAPCRAHVSCVKTWVCVRDFLFRGTEVARNRSRGKPQWSNSMALAGQRAERTSFACEVLGVGLRVLGMHTFMSRKAHTASFGMSKGRLPSVVAPTTVAILPLLCGNAHPAIKRATLRLLDPPLPAHSLSPFLSCEAVCCHNGRPYAAAMRVGRPLGSRWGLRWRHCSNAWSAADGWSREARLKARLHRAIRPMSCGAAPRHHTRHPALPGCCRCRRRCRRVASAAGAGWTSRLCGSRPNANTAMRPSDTERAETAHSVTRCRPDSGHGARSASHPRSPLRRQRHLYDAWEHGVPQCGPSFKGRRVPRAARPARLGCVHG